MPCKKSIGLQDRRDLPRRSPAPPAFSPPGTAAAPAAKAGCAPIATSQIIYNYRRNNYRDIDKIPTGYIVDDNGKLDFDEGNTSVWSQIRDTASSNDDENMPTAIFIVYLSNLYQIVLMNLEFF